MSPKVHIKKIFIYFVQLYGITGELIANAILHILRNHKIDVTKCRGQNVMTVQRQCPLKRSGSKVESENVVERRYMYIHIAIVMC